MKHTPGPWYPIDFAGYQVIKTEPYYDSGIDILNLDECDVANANARVIAAAPDLLEACEEAVSTIDMLMGDDIHPSASMSLNRIIKAIRKATE